MSLCTACLVEILQTWGSTKVAGGVNAKLWMTALGTEQSLMQ